MSSPAPDLAAGQRIRGNAGEYALERVLGVGGFGTTWLARRVADGQVVALKALALDRMGEWKALELFEREGQVLAELAHPAIPRVHEFFVSDGERPLPAGVAPPPGRAPRWILVQDFFEGRSLRQLIDARGRLDDARAAAILRRLLGVLDYLHSRRPPVIHRDITPANVLLGPDDAPTLVDFGAIQDRLRGEGSGGSTTVGTFGFVPIEQLMGRARPASDLYALGMTMLVALSHLEPEHLPIDEATGKVKIDEAAPGLSPGLRRVLDAMLEPIVGQRVQSAGDALALLDGGAAVARRGAVLPAPVAAGGLWRAIGSATIGASMLMAGVLYIALFDMFSERMLVRLSVVWVCGLAIGLGIRLAGDRNPLVNGLLWGGVAALGMIVFIFGIFPSL